MRKNIKRCFSFLLAAVVLLTSIEFYTNPDEVKAASRDTVTIELGDSVINISDTGYSIGGVTKSGAFNYVISGEYKGPDYDTQNGMSAIVWVRSFTGNITMKDVTVVRDGCSAIHFSEGVNCTMSVVGTNTLENTYSATSGVTTAKAYPSISVEKDAKVKITGSGEIHTKSGAVPAIGVRYGGTFNGILEFNGGTIYADSRTTAAGTVMGCTPIGVASTASSTGEFIFSGSHIITETVKTGHTAIGYALVNGQDVAQACSTKITITGGILDLAAGMKASAIGASSNTDSPTITIKGGTININIATSNTIAIGGAGGDTGSNINTTSHAGNINITGGVLNLKTSSKAPLIGDQLYNTSPCTINISGGKFILEKPYSKTSGVMFGGKVNVNNYKLLHITAGTTSNDAADVLYSSYIQENYLSNIPVTIGYMYIDKCTSETHTYACEPISGDKSSHTRFCKWCNYQAVNAKHEYTYNASNNTIYEVCVDCKYQNTLQLPAASKVPYANKEYPVVPILNNFQNQDITIEYGLNGENFTTTAPTNVGVYTVKATVDGVSISTTLEIERAEGWTFSANNYSGIYDKLSHTGGVSVTEPAGAVITYGYNTAELNLSEIPKYDKVGTYTFYAKLSANNYADVIIPITVEITPKYIDSVTVLGVTTPEGGELFDPAGTCNTEGISNTVPNIIWVLNDASQSGTAKYNTAYDAQITLYPNTDGYRFNQTISKDSCNLDSVNADSVILNGDGSLTLHKTLTSPKAKLLSVTDATSISGLANGTPFNAPSLGLPTSLTVETEDPNIKSLLIDWNLESFVSGSYNENSTFAQVFTLQGTLQLPDSIDANGIDLNRNIQVSVLAGTVAAPEVTVAPGTYTEDSLSVSLTCATPTAEIYYTTNGTEPTKGSTLFSGTPILLAGESGRRITHTIKAKAFVEGMYDSNTSTYTYVINKGDVTPPEITITVDDNSWHDLRTVIFRFFGKVTKNVDIVYSDDSGNLTLKQYYIADRSLTEAQLSRAEWKDYTGRIYLEPTGKFIVYAKAVDAYENVTYVGSDGFVIYEDSKAATQEVDVIKGVTEYMSFFVTTNGNSVKDVYIDDNLLDADAYEKEDYSNVITLMEDSYNDLTYGTHEIKVTYNPQGEEYIESAVNSEPAITTCALNVNRISLLSVTQPEDVLDVPNGTALANMEAYLPTAVSVITESVEITSLPVIWNVAYPSSGSYNQNNLAEQSFTLDGTIQLPDTMRNNDISTTVTVKVTVNRANQCARPKADVPTGRYSDSFTVTLTSTDGADIYYTLDGSVPTESSNRYSAPIEVNANSTIKAFCAKTGMLDSSVMIVSYTIYKADKTPPTGKIEIGKESIWTSFFNAVTFGFFTKDSQKVTITAEDAESSVKAIFYYISPIELTTSQLGTLNGWELYVEPFHLSQQSKGIVYAKLINKDDYASYINSNGVVVYADSVPVSDTVTYIKGSSIDPFAIVQLNGNTVTGVKQGKTALKPETEYGSGASGKITIASSYLEKLSLGTYTFTVSYAPMGVSATTATGHSTKIKDSTFKLTITNAPTNSGSGSGGTSSSGSSSSSSSGSSSSGGGTTQPVTPTSDDNKVTDNSTSDGKGGTIQTVTSTDNKGNKVETVTHTEKDGSESMKITESYKNGTVKVTNSVQLPNGDNSIHEVTKLNGKVTYEYQEKCVDDVLTSKKFVTNSDGSTTEVYKTEQKIENVETVVNMTTKVKSDGTKTVKTIYTVPEYNSTTSAKIEVSESNSSKSATATISKSLGVSSTTKISKSFVDKLLAIANAQADGVLNSPDINQSTMPARSTYLSNLDISQKCTDTNGKTRFTLMMNTSIIKPDANVYLWKTSSSGKQTAIAGYKYKVNDGGVVSVSKTDGAKYTLVSSAENKKLNTAMKDATALKKSSGTLKENKTTTLALKTTLSSANVKSIKYTSSKKSVAKVNSKGKVTAVDKGKATINATVTYKNGVTKKLKYTLKVS